jgi:lysozyme
MSRRRQKWFFRIFLLSVLITALIVGVSLYSKWRKYQRAAATHYPEFGIMIPDEYTIHGIDVSRYQNIIAWEEVKKMQVRGVSLGFSYIKATEGISNIDPRYDRNWKKAKDAGLYRGAYHFFIASKDGKMQAQHFIGKVQLEPGDLPPVLDIEQLNGVRPAELKKEALEFLQVLEEYYQVKPVIYTNVDFYERYLGKPFDKYPLWVAHYYQSNEPRISRGWSLWQHNDEGRVNGITTRVDFNVFNGDSLSFRDFLIK